MGTTDYTDCVRRHDATSKYLVALGEHYRCTLLVHTSSTGVRIASKYLWRREKVAKVGGDSGPPATATTAATLPLLAAADKMTTDPESRLFALSELLTSEVAFLKKIHSGLKRGNVDDTLMLFLRSQHLHMPHIHAHPIYSMMRACAAAGAASEVLLGTADASWPHPASEFGQTDFDRLFFKASTRLPPQQHLDYRELNSALGLMFTDRSVAAIRWCFGDVFHATLEDAEEDLLEEDEEGQGNEEDDGAFSLKQRRSKRRTQLPLLEQHLIKERAANFSPLL